MALKGTQTPAAKLGSGLLGWMLPRLKRDGAPSREHDPGLLLCRAVSWGEKTQSTTDAGSLNPFGRNEIEVAPISSALLRIACLVMLYKTCGARLAADTVSAISAKLGLPHETDARHRAFTVQTAVSAPSTTRSS